MPPLSATVWQTLQEEFSDIGDVQAYTRILTRLAVAVILGGLIGYERERSGKAAGLRTHMLVSLGAALFVLAPLQAGMEVNDMSRVLQGVISGIGFLGAGAIIKASAEGEVKGLTTAASIWLTAAIGIAAGMGKEVVAIVSTLLALAILDQLRRLERRINGDAPDQPPSRGGDA
ncbi:MgtC/SapB family protein [Bordetella bronchialis]|uniref:Protein MgtC n=1 Tax=Bordetella bronchialis TaxID=463025 RepID=A0A193FMC2_9BORD|nr:MgtC/SapB family protein [Bordetella bronchialis]ANN68403.1 methyltransferase [Bordetella bronchialis]ANN73544.1 methyltransferase [Bordetella bronchialis]